jgi:hypothetical protein
MNVKRDVRFFYQVGQDIFYLNDGDDDNLKKETIKQKIKNAYNINYFEAFKGYECNVEDLKRYRDDFNKEALELVELKNTKDKKEALKIYYKKYYKHENAVMFVFGMRSTNILKSLRIQNIIFNEFHIYEMCNNGALMTLSNEYKNKIIKSYGYDHSSYHPTLLASDYYTSESEKIGQTFVGDDFKFPIKQGKFINIKIDLCKDNKDYEDTNDDNNYDYTKLKYGIYYCKIICDNPDFRKVFAFNKDNYYPHYDVIFACKYKKVFNIKTTNLASVVIYEDEDLIYSHEIFKDWYNGLSQLKKDYPKNKLLKHVFSSLWGSLIRFEREFREDGEIFNMDVSDIDDKVRTEYKVINEKHYKCDKSKTQHKTLYEVIKSDKPYSNNLARLKPFFTSFLRVNIGELCIKENILNNVIRIHTDNITLNKPHDFTHLKYYPIKEDKTTGCFLWKNVNKYPSYDEETNTYTWRNEPYINI